MSREKVEEFIISEYNLLMIPDKIEVQYTNIYQVRQFITRVWQHPLLDERTRGHRNLAEGGLEEFLTNLRIDKSTYFTIPVGSLIWIVNDASDFDYMLITKTQEVSKLIHKSVAYNDETWSDFKNRRLSILPNYPENLDDYLDGSSKEFTPLLFTPDEFIGGNKEFAQSTRLSIINKLTEKGYSQEDWKIVIQMQFDILFRNWDNISSPTALRYRQQKAPGKNRADRITTNLNIRANQTHNPERYKIAFQKAREGLIFPDFQIYSQAIIESNGKLNLLAEKNFAIGVKESNKNQ